MKKIFRFIIFLIIPSMMVSCSDFLDRQPMDFFQPDDINEPEDIEKLLTGTYRTLIYRKNLRVQPLSQDFVADDGYCDLQSYGEQLLWMGEQTPNDGYLEQDKWERNYMGILRANSVIEYAPKIKKLSASLRNRYIAEAKFLRAYFYADLIDYYGDVPYRTEVEGLKEKISPRVDKNVILNNILLDLDEAAEILPVGYENMEDFGRATKGAALALKARVCLYNYKYDWCIKACRAVMDLGKYELHPSYEELFTAKVEKTNREYIFTQQYVAGKSNEQLSGIFWTKFAQWSGYMVSYNLVEEYYMKSTGLRYDSEGSGYTDTTPYVDRDPRLGYTLTLSSGSDTFTGFKVKKFVDHEANADKIPYNDEVDYPLIRYADVLLMLAEALVESGNYDYYEVCSYVDAVRQRGDVLMPTIENAEGKYHTLSTDELRDVIRHERRVEFAIEGLRYSDIRRWKIGPEAISDCYSFVKITNTDDPENPFTYYEKQLFVKRTFNEAKGYLWPIPAIEIQTNPIPNNPGYDGAN